MHKVKESSFQLICSKHASSACSFITPSFLLEILDKNRRISKEVDSMFDVERGQCCEQKEDRTDCIQHTLHQYYPCADRESNPGQMLGRHLCYHYTIGATNHSENITNHDTILQILFISNNITFGNLVPCSPIILILSDILAELLLLWYYTLYYHLT